MPGRSASALPNDQAFYLALSRWVFKCPGLKPLFLLSASSAGLEACLQQGGPAPLCFSRGLPPKIVNLENFYG